MAKFFAIICIMLAVGYVYIKRSAESSQYGAPSAAQTLPVPGKEAAAPAGVNGFMGKTGYLMELPAGFEAVPSMKGNTEVVYFLPKGTQLSSDEAKFRELRIVRLEVTPLQIDKDLRLSLEIVKKGVAATLNQNKETFTASDLKLGLPAFEIDIVKPRELTQVFLEGANELYMFTGGDKELIYSLARAVKETGAGK